MIVVLGSAARLGWKAGALGCFWGVLTLGHGHGLLHRARQASKYNKWASEAGRRW